ncbi:hypothetical protein [Sphingomonas sp.]|uniref:hypothetical protein n=1 Tax=Sphingomonas sp. TaxID=28214 RepID=UPI002ED84B91
MAELEYQCCYCEEGIAKGDIGAVRIVISGLWAQADGSTQEVYAHSECAADKFGRALSSSVPFDIQAFAPD